MLQRLLLIAALCSLSQQATAQIVELHRPAVDKAGEVSALSGTHGLCDSGRAAEVFERALLEVFTQGQLQAGAQLVRLCIGEPEKFTFPLYLVVGAATPAVGNATPAQNTTAALLNPLGGNLNLQVNNTHRLYVAGEYTELSIAYLLGAKYLRGQSSTNPADGLGLLVGDAELGLRFQTGAFDLDHPGKAGVFWFQLKSAAHVGSTARLTTLFGTPASSVINLSAELGIEIADRINLKGSWYETLNNRDVGGLRDAVFKSGLDYKR